jgi:hypothetical protein
MPESAKALTEAPSEMAVQASPAPSAPPVANSPVSMAEMSDSLAEEVRMLRDSRTALEGYLGGRKLDTFKPIAVRVELSAVPGGRFHAALSLDAGASGDRRFEGATCARVGDAAVLIVALMLDPVEVTSQIETSPAVPRREAPTASADRRRERTARSETSAPRVGRAAFEVGIETAGDAGSLPQPSVGAGVVAGLRIGRALVEADAVAWVPRRGLGGPTPGGGGEIGLYSASLRGCFAVVRSLESGIALEPCLRLESGLASGRGFGIADPASSKNVWGAAFLGLSIRQWSTASLGGWLSIEGGAPFVRTRYVIEDFGTVFRASALVGRLSFGLAWSFP